MVTETMKSSHSNAEAAERSHKLLDKEIRGMLSAITHRVSGSSSGHHQQHQEDQDDHEEKGVRVITLAGTNTGATMRSELDDKLSPVDVEDEALSTYVNSNFQSVNNSIMFGSSYNANDPGVHMEISEPFEHEGERKHKKKGKKKEKEKEKEKERHSQHSD